MPLPVDEAQTKECPICNAVFGPKPNTTASAWKVKKYCSDKCRAKARNRSVKKAMDQIKNEGTPS